MAKKTENAEEIGERISDFLKKNGLKPSEIARQVDIAPSVITGVTQGKQAPGCPLLVYLATIGADINYLLTGAARRVDDTALASFLDDWPDLDTQERMTIVNDAHCKATANRVKKDKKKSIS